MFVLIYQHFKDTAICHFKTSQKSTQSMFFLMKYIKYQIMVSKEIITLTQTKKQKSELLSLHFKMRES